MHVFRLGWTNARRVPATLLIEPWGEDYTAPPGGRLDFLFRAVSPDLRFNVYNEEDGTVDLYLEGEAPRLGPVEWEVLLDGARIELGHNRHLSTKLGSRPPA